MIAGAAVALLAAGGIALAARGADEERAPKGSDLTVIKCPLVATGQTADGVEQYKAAENAFDTAELVGLSVDDARARAAEHGCEVVVSLEDGKGVPVPIDVDPTRIYVYVEKGVVTEIEGVGGGL